MSAVVRLMRSEADRLNAGAHREIVTVLSADNPVYEIDEVRFVGLTLWADWAQAARWLTGTAGEFEAAARARAVASHPKTGPREYGAIRTERGGWTPYDAVAEHAREKAILLDELFSTHEGPTVVVTHHPPLAACADAYRDHRLPWWAPVLYIRYPADVARPDAARDMDLWSCSLALHPNTGGTRVVCNPVEGGMFKPDLRVRDLNMAKDEVDFPDDGGPRRIVKYDPVGEEGMPSCAGA